MSQSANVRSVEAIRDFRAALANFAEDAHTALSSVEMEIRRTRDWLQRDQLTHWQATVKRCNELVSMARTELHRRRLSQSNSDAISDTEQKENLRNAQRRLEEAEDKVRRIKSWIPVLDQAIAEYHAASQPLSDRLTGALVGSLSLLDRTLISIESYLTLAPPATPPPSPSERVAEPAPTRASASTSEPATLAVPSVRAKAAEAPESNPANSSEEPST